MTEKRFTMDNESDIIEFDYNTNEYIQDFMWADGKSWDKICNRLNELFDENEQLKSFKEQNINEYLKLKEVCNECKKENEQLKQQLKEFEDYVYSDEKILCYTCVNCLSKGIYEVECSEKGKVDVHGSCFSYWENELKGDVE